MELTDEQVQSMTTDQFLAHHGLTRDEPFADTGMTVDDFLAHYGVMGMHWGIRKGKGTTGVSRARGAVIDRNKRYLHVNQLMRSGRKFRGTAMVGRALMGREDFRRKLKQRATDLNAQNNRLKSGQLSVMDRLDVLGWAYVMPTDMLISVTPNRQAARWQRDPLTGRGEGV